MPTLTKATAIANTNNMASNEGTHIENIPMEMLTLNLSDEENTTTSNLSSPTAIKIGPNESLYRENYEVYVTQAADHLPSDVEATRTTSPTKMKIGPNESLYREKYEAYVTQAISNHEQRLKKNGGKLRDYASLSNGEKERAIEDVSALLDRILSLKNKNNDRDAEEDDDTTANSSSFLLQSPNNENYEVTEEDEHVFTQRDGVESSFGIGQSTVHSNNDKHAHGIGAQRKKSASNTGGNERKCSAFNDHQEHSFPDDINTSEISDDTRLTSPGSISCKSPILDSVFSESELLSDYDNHQASFDYGIDDQDENDCSSVEIGRERGRDSSMLLLSPPLRGNTSAHHRSKNKRLATTSGKKGMDMQRIRSHPVDDYDNYNEQFDQMSLLDMIDSPHHSGNGRNCGRRAGGGGGGDDVSFLLASQSPIEKCGTQLSHSPMRGEDIFDDKEAISDGDSPIRPRRVMGSSDVNDEEYYQYSETRKSSSNAAAEGFRKKTSSGFNSSSNNNDYVNDTIETVDCSFVPKRLQRHQKGKQQKQLVSEAAPSTVRLKEGACFRMQPLQIRQARTRKSNKNISLSFPDPLEPFSHRMTERLKIVMLWLEEKENEIKDEYNDEENGEFRSECDELDYHGKGVVLGLGSVRTRAVALKLLRNHGARASRQRTSVIEGGTLLVLRNKDDIDNWERIFREKSSFSVLNHGNLAPTARKRLGAQRCAGFDIVLTTYDAIKTKEQTYQVNEYGCTVTQDCNDSNGWYSSRGSETGGGAQNCMRMSVLHGVHWSRIIFVDDMGRGSYVAKVNTGRAVAGRALNGKLRYIFFGHPKEGSFGCEEKLKEDKKQLSAIAAILHAPPENSAEYIVGEALIDFKDVTVEKNNVSVDDSLNISQTSVNQSPYYYR